MPPPVEIKDANELMGYYMVSGTGVILFIMSCYIIIYSILAVLVKLHTLSIGTEDQEMRQKRPCDEIELQTFCLENSMMQFFVK